VTACPQLLDELRLAMRERGRDVDRHLKPRLSREELLEQTQPLGLTVPEELVELYEWRNGQGEDAEMSQDALIFRDNKFVDVAGALREYPLIQEYWGPPEPDTLEFGFDLRESFPFATYMGSSYVLVCGEHTLASPHPHPVVNVFQGVELFFHSLETMLRTCIDWVRHPAWGTDSDLPEDVELEIWLRHNPGLFGR
jgi:hypothetical protein